MDEFRTFTIGNRTYRTDGAVMQVREASELDARYSKAIPKLVNNTLEHFAGKPPLFTANVRVLRAALEVFSENDAVAVHFEANDKPILIVCRNDRFAIVMPLAPGTTIILVPAHDEDTSAVNGAEQPT